MHANDEGDSEEEKACTNDNPHCHDDSTHDLHAELLTARAHIVHVGVGSILDVLSLQKMQTAIKPHLQQKQWMMHTSQGSLICSRHRMK